MKLSELETGKSAIITRITGYSAFRKRVQEMGFVIGRKIEAVFNAPLHDPVVYRIMGYEISMRRKEAEMIEIVPENETASDEIPVGNGVIETSAKARHCVPNDTITVALIGNPNCGKTTLFNFASGARERTGNYAGVTVGTKTGTFSHGGYNINIVDLPGTYSLSSLSAEERYVRDYLRTEEPDIILNVVDASNLERNLYLTTDLIDMDRPMVIDLNIYDELVRQGVKLDYEKLGQMIGVPIVPTNSKSGDGIPALFDKIIEVYEGRCKEVRHVHVRLNQDIEKAISTISRMLKEDKTLDLHFSRRYIATKLIQGDHEAERLLENTKSGRKILKERNILLAGLEKTFPDAIDSVIAADRYGFIAGALAEVTEYPDDTPDHGLTTDRIDRWVTSRYFGFPIFILIMLFIFWATFYLGAFPMEWIEDGCGLLSDAVQRFMPEGILKDLIADGIIGGVGGVIVFLPNILILYFFISFMEDTGYMARAAFIMDRLMHRIGLHGKSFIPLVMGFGCNVPAVMACRTIESRSSRIITILINPFISCSARLPVYVLLIGTFFSAHAALMFFLIYLLGIVVAMVSARLLRRFRFKVDETPFVMELPPYRLPTLKSSMRHMWWKAQQYLRKMGGIILVASIVVWALNYFPRHNETELIEEGTATAQMLRDDSRIDLGRDSFLEVMGKAVTPVFEPLGFSWRASVAIIAGIPAKEIVVSTLGVLYTGDDTATDRALSARLTKPSPLTGKPDFNHANALAFIVFILLYCPCIATLTAIVRETHNWRYGLFSACYNTGVAWVAAFIVYHIALLF